MQGNEIRVTFSIAKVTVLSLFLTVALMFLAGIFHLLLHGTAGITFTMTGIFTFGVAFMVAIVLHEAFHLIGFRIAGKIPWSEMALGVDLKKGIAYAHSRQKLKVKAMRIALILPFYFTGLLPYIIGILIDSIFLSLLGALLIGGCAGDFAFLYKTRKFPPEALVIDHPTKPEFTVTL